MALFTTRHQTSRAPSSVQTLNVSANNRLLDERIWNFIIQRLEHHRITHHQMLHQRLAVKSTPFRFFFSISFCSFQKLIFSFHSSLCHRMTTFCPVFNYLRCTVTIFLLSFFSVTKQISLSPSFQFPIWSNTNTVWNLLLLRLCFLIWLKMLQCFLSLFFGDSCESFHMRTHHTVKLHHIGMWRRKWMSSCQNKKETHS